MIVLCQWTHGATPTITVAKFRDDKPAAISFTFDDGSQSQATIVAPLFEEFGYRATFFVIAGLTREKPSDPVLTLRRDWAAVTWAEWRDVVARGHEIGSHSWSHPKLTLLNSGSELRHQLAASARLIEKKVDRPVRAIAFPYNQFNNGILDFARRYYIAIRTRWSDYTVLAKSVDEANQMVLRTIAGHSWMVPNLHGVDEGYGPVSRDFLREHLAFIKARDSQVWVDTYSTITRYCAEQQRAKVNVLQTSSNSCEFTVTCPLPPRDYDVPLTIVLHQSGAATARAVCNGEPLPVRVLADKILVSTVPAPQSITVEWN